MAGTLIGYARCSIYEQDLTAQRNGLEALRVEPDRIYLDKEIWDTWPLHELLDYDSDGDLTRGIYTLPQWTLFSEDFSGNSNFIDLAPGPAGVVGQVIEAGSNWQQVKPVAPSLTALLHDEIENANLGRT